MLFVCIYSVYKGSPSICIIYIYRGALSLICKIGYTKMYAASYQRQDSSSMQWQREFPLCPKKAMNENILRLIWYHLPRLSIIILYVWENVTRERNSLLSAQQETHRPHTNTYNWTARLGHRQFNRRRRCQKLRPQNERPLLCWANGYVICAVSISRL